MAAAGARLYLGVRKPKRAILGMELAGVIESAGRAVTRFKPGDEVFASTFAVNLGGYVEYKCLPEDGVVALKPASLSFGEAAALPARDDRPALPAQGEHPQRAKSPHIRRIGCGGHYAVQLARGHFGADVTGVCSTANLELVRSLGAGRVIDYTQQDFTQGTETYDVIFDAVGKLSPVQTNAARKLAGSYLNVLTASDGGKSIELLLALKEQVEAGVIKPVIDRRYTLEEVVEAHRYVEKGHKKGSVVITVV